ncbi:hypothetical protein [Pedobacter aquatilis]|uniref:tetratricopeptide repeat protein n=1 Tax=Pedobacter aquatilis TaxID=351343 RepID=UPI00292D5833|nr:hypothetical protein [Pedobacter aquatilis]
MKKTYLLSFLLFITVSSAFSQTKNIEDLYEDYTMLRMTNDEKSKAIAVASDLLKRSSELKEKQIANATYHLGRLYEETNQMNLAIPYYEKSIKLTPGYYVPYLALGSYYFKDCQEMAKKINEAALAKDITSHKKLTEDYQKLTKSTAAYLEKSYACDPDETTKSKITFLYQSSKNNEALKSFDSRIKELEKGCITLLDDE